jgi:hypothetical protein
MRSSATPQNQLREMVVNKYIEKYLLKNHCP